MTTIIGNHLKMHLPYSVRERASRFYVELLGCRKLSDLPYPNVDLFEFEGGFVLGLFFSDEGEALSEREQVKATWMEIKTDDPMALKEKLIGFGVREVEFEDQSRFYFQAPGGPVFRIAPLEGGL
jgi:hypothetical protein